MTTTTANENQQRAPEGRATTLAASVDALPLPPIQVYNTLSRQKEVFETIEPGKVRMYVCGVTVYDSAHIGHGMSAIVFDVIRRYLEYRGYDVRHAQNFTDIDDKIINRANAEGIDPFDLTERLIAEWIRDTTDLNILPATVYPRATQEIGAIIKMIQTLMDKGYAYQADGDVYYRVRAFKGYGKLSHRDLDELMVGARIDVDERKDDPLDFALWKAAKPGEPKWPSPFSEGRPGWHIECSAMCTTHLGGQVDIHGGGADLIFPHHENEIAQSEAALGVEPFARYWVHNGLLQLSGEKMSKSLGNFITIREIADRGLADAFRLLVLQSHYRVPLTFTEEGLLAADNGLSRLRAAVRPSGPAPAGPSHETDAEVRAAVTEAVRGFHAALSNDFNTSEAVAHLFDLARTINRVASTAGETDAVADARDVLRELTGTLGLRLDERESGVGDAVPFIDLLIRVRDDLRQAKQWALADKIRDELAKLGIVVEDTPSGGTWRRA